MADLGEFAEAIAAGEEGLRIAQTHGHAHSEAWARYGLGYAYLRRGDFASAVRVLEPGLALCRAMGLRLALPFVAAELGSAHLSCARTAAAVPLLEEAGEAFTGLGNVLRSLFITLLAEPYLVLGRVAEARELAEQVVALARTRRERGWEAWGLKLLGDVHAHAPAEAEQAGDPYRQALALATELGMRPLVAHCHFGLGKLYRKTNKRDQGQEHLTTATTMYREMGMQFWLEQDGNETR
jgi:tetratricopeptide (TPR) repeat protein